MGGNASLLQAQTALYWYYYFFVIDTSVDVLGHIISDVSWDPRVFRISQHQTPSLRPPSRGWSGPDLCLSSVGPLFGTFNPNLSTASVTDLMALLFTAPVMPRRLWVLHREQAAKPRLGHSGLSTLSILWWAPGTLAACTHWPLPCGPPRVLLVSIRGLA